MYLLMVAVFVIGYVAIALEHNIGIDKAASALITGVVCWTIYVLGAQGIVNFEAIPHYIGDMFREKSHITEETEFITHYVTHFQILEHLGEIGSI